jgi:uncharacterized protein YndB with AHSA1/START domain
MEIDGKQSITVQATVNAPIEKVWKCWTSAEDIVQWNNASADWHTTRAVNDLQAGQTFSFRMEAKDGSMGFDFWGTYEKVIHHELIEYTLGDSRQVRILFTSSGTTTDIVETFEAENENTFDLQRGGWQAILDNFKKYIESNR